MEEKHRQVLLTIHAIVKETADSFSYYFQSPAPVSYKAGQFITLLININNKIVRRSYSLGSTPGIDNELFITVKRKTNGEVSRYMQDHFQTGQQIVALPPAGRFVLDEISSEQYIFFAAGSGIVPIFSLIKELLHHYPESNIRLFYQCRNEAEVIYKKALELLANDFNARFTLNFYFTTPHSGIGGIRMNNFVVEKILKEIPGADTSKFYICGPEAFMRMVHFTIRVAGIEEENIRQENFVIYEPFVPKDIDLSPKKITATLNGETFHFITTYPQTILSAALANKIELPYSCRGGRCSSCMTVCKTGKVKMSINDVLTARDLANQYILTCTAHPETDIEIVYP